LKARRKYRNRLVLGLTVVLLLFGVLRVQAYLSGNSKRFVENRISTALGAQVSIAQLNVTPAWPLFTVALHGIKIHYKNNFQIYLNKLDIACKLGYLSRSSVSGIFTGAEITAPSKIPNLTDLSGQIEMTRQGLTLHSVRAKLLDIPLELEAYITNPAGNPEFDLIVCPQQDRRFAGKLSLKGNIDKFVINGYVKIPPQSEIRIDGNYLEGQIETVVKIQHLPVYTSDLICNLDLKAVLRGEEKYDLLEGRLSSSGTVINHQPFSEFESRFSLDLVSKKLSIQRLIISGHYFLQGDIDLYPPYPAKISLDIQNAPMDNIMLFSQEKPKWTLGDRFSGALAISGSLLKPFCKGKLSAGKGVFKNARYDSIEVNMEGTYPLLPLYNSRIYKPEGNIAIVGALNFEAKNLFQDVKLVSNGNIVWNGWDISRKPYSDLIEMEKELGEEIKIGFKGYIQDETNYGRQDGGEVELEFKVDENQSLKMKMRENEDTLGYEHSVKF